MQISDDQNLTGTLVHLLTPIVDKPRSVFGCLESEQNCARHRNGD